MKQTFEKDGSNSRARNLLGILLGAIAGLLVLSMF
jgi:hypothetical protein